MIFPFSRNLGQSRARQGLVMLLETCTCSRNWAGAHAVTVPGLDPVLSLQADFPCACLYSGCARSAIPHAALPPLFGKANHSPVCSQNASASQLLRSALPSPAVTRSCSLSAQSPGCNEGGCWPCLGGCDSWIALKIVFWFSRPERPRIFTFVLLAG